MEIFSLAILLSISLGGAWVTYSWYCLLLNYLEAQKIGIPLRVIPISHENPLWMVVDKKMFIPLFERPSFGSGNFTRYNWRGWEFADKYNSHLEMGDVFMLVTPGRNWLYVCNAEVLVELLQRKSDFPRPLGLFGMHFSLNYIHGTNVTSEMVNKFGPNLSTVSVFLLIYTYLTYNLTDRWANLAEASKNHSELLQRTKQ